MPQTHDLAGENPAKAQELRAMLDAWRGKVNAIMPTPNPDWTGKANPKKTPKNKPTRPVK